MANLDSAIERIVETHRRVPADRCTLVAISGIDASGKGYLAANMVQALRRLDLRGANINIDGWLNLPQVRFRKNNPAENFYRNAIRFEDMFRQLVFPLRDSGSLRIEMDYAEETATIYRKQLYEFKDIDIILLEGIYLLKRQYQTYYDLSFWIDCTFETALERALARGQESLPPEATIKAYRTIYFPAQEVHFAENEAKRAASAIITNDPRLES